jgi:hypothetical protein
MVPRRFPSPPGIHLPVRHFFYPDASIGLVRSGGWLGIGLWCRRRWPIRIEHHKRLPLASG